MAERGRLRPEINQRWCKNCGLCVAFCAKEVFVNDALGRPQISQPQECEGCRTCLLRCPDIAIQLIANDNEGKG